MGQVKTIRKWRPSLLQGRVGEVAQRTAEQEAAGISWPQLQEAREKYVEWEAFALWVRAIEEAEGDVPQWLAKIVDKRCRGFLKFAEDGERDQSDSLPFVWRCLERSVNERNFSKAWWQGWMNAVGYYAGRDLASLRNHAYWEYCERLWKRSKPAAYPAFRDWLRASERSCDRALDECEMPEEKRRLLKLSRRVGPQTLRKAVERYVEWEVFAYWARTALEARSTLPASVEREVRQRCPGFLEAEAAARAANPKEELLCRFNRMIKWIEDNEFADAQNRGWFDVLRYQARFHPRHIRIIDYWHDWEAGRAKQPAARHPSFIQWRDAADRYTFEPDES